MVNFNPYKSQEKEEMMISQNVNDSTSEFDMESRVDKHFKNKPKQYLHTISE